VNRTRMLVASTATSPNVLSCCASGSRALSGDRRGRYPYFGAARQLRRIAATAGVHTASSFWAANGFGSSPEVGALDNSHGARVEDPPVVLADPWNGDPNAHLPLPLSPFRGD